jgi:hypothetical protein
MPELVISGAVICLGSAIFLIAAFSPVSRVFGVSSPEQKLDIINNSPRGWRLTQVLFAAGSLITALGVGLLAFALKWLPAVSLYLPAALLLIGATAWSMHVYMRMIDPQAFVSGALPAWHFRLFTLLTLAAFFLLGIELLYLLGSRPWQGYFLMAVSMFLLILYFKFRDMPPFVYYLLGLVLGVSLVLNG